MRIFFGIRYRTEVFLRKLTALYLLFSVHFVRYVLGKKAVIYDVFEKSK
jgi:hypothetical protein